MKKLILPFLLILSNAAFADAKLSEDQMKGLIPGNSVDGFADALGKNYKAFYSPDGVLVQLLEGKMKRKGTWKIEGDQFCTQFPTEKPKCTAIYRMDNGEYKRVKDDGMQTNTMKKFAKGNAFNL